MRTKYMISRKNFTLFCLFLYLKKERLTNQAGQKENINKNYLECFADEILGNNNEFLIKAFQIAFL